MIARKKIDRKKSASRSRGAAALGCSSPPRSHRLPTQRLRGPVASAGWRHARRLGPLEAPPFQLHDLATDPRRHKISPASHPEIVQRLGRVLREIVERGHGTPGASQPYDTNSPWPQLAWMKSSLDEIKSRPCPRLSRVRRPRVCAAGRPDLSKHRARLRPGRSAAAKPCVAGPRTPPVAWRCFIFSHVPCGALAKKIGRRKIGRPMTIRTHPRKFRRLSATV